MKKIFLLSIITSLIISALVAIFIFIFSNFGDTEFRILFTTLSIGGYCLTALCSSVLYDKKKYTAYTFLGIIIALVGFLITIMAVWDIVSTSEIWRWMIIFIILSCSIAHSSLLLLAKSDNKNINILIDITMVFIASVAGILIYIMTSNSYDVGEQIFRTLGVLAVLDVLGTIIVPILKRMKTANI